MSVWRRLGVHVILIAHLATLVAPAWAEHSSPHEHAPADVAISENIEQRAGGWNVATPLLIAGSELYQGLRGEGDGLQASDVFNGRVMRGLAGDVGALGATWLAVRYLPVPPVARIALMTAAGFLGWEFASGDYRKTDWVELGAQIVAAAAVQFALPVVAAAAGITLGPIAIMAAGIAAAVGTGMLISWLRSRGKDEPGPDEQPGHPPGGPRAGGGAPDAPGEPPAPRASVDDPPEGGDGPTERLAPGPPPGEDLAGLPSYDGLETAGLR